jgi:ligand-binding sensor domain-containing protein
MSDSGSIPSWTTAAKDLAECLAFLSAAVFFLYKVGAGYLKVDLSMSAKCDRHHTAHQSKDNLVIHVHLKKGPNGSLALHDAKARVMYQDSHIEVAFPGIRRSSFEPAPDGAGRKINWKVSKTSPLLRMIPGEETELTTVCEVPSGEVCKIEIVILGKTDVWSRFGQWKASCVSLPSH